MRLNDGWRAVFELFGMFLAFVGSVVCWLWALDYFGAWVAVATVVAWVVWLLKVTVYDAGRFGDWRKRK